MKSLQLLSTVAVIGALTACGGKHPGSFDAAAVTTTSAAPADELTTKLAEADAQWEERGDEAKLTAALQGYEAALALDPANRHAHERLVRGWYFYGDAFTDDDEVRVQRWAKSIEFGTRCLALNSQIAEAIKGGQKEKDAVGLATKTDVPCLYWTSTSLGKWAKLQGTATTLKYLPTVRAYMTQVDTHDPTYWHFGPARYWGALYSALPSFAGQDTEKSGQNFEASLAGAPDYLGTRVLRAEFLAVTTGDAKLFKTELEHVLAADATKIPGAEPENLKEQEKAKKLLSQMNELFDKKAIEAAN